MMKVVAPFLNGNLNMQRAGDLVAVADALLGRNIVTGHHTKVLAVRLIRFGAFNSPDNYWPAELCVKVRVAPSNFFGKAVEANAKTVGVKLRFRFTVDDFGDWQLATGGTRLESSRASTLRDLVCEDTAEAGPGSPPPAQQPVPAPAVRQQSTGDIPQGVGRIHHFMGLMHPDALATDTKSCGLNIYVDRVILTRVTMDGDSRNAVLSYGAIARILLAPVGDGPEAGGLALSVLPKDPGALINWGPNWKNPTSFKFVQNHRQNPSGLRSAYEQLKNAHDAWLAKSSDAPRQ